MYKYIQIFFIALAPFLLMANVSVTNDTKAVNVEKKISVKETAILGVIQGITEFMPVSSTAHMILAYNYLLCNGNETIRKGFDCYLIFINLGTILALVFYFKSEIQQMVFGFLNKNKRGRKLLINLIVAFLPSAIVGVFLKDLIRNYLYTSTCIAYALILGGVAIFLTNSLGKRTKSTSFYDIETEKALIIGVFQILALIPGFSRSLSTIIGGILIGLNISQAIRFSFLLGLLTSSAASIYSIMKGGAELINEVDMYANIIGIFVAFIVSILSLRFLLKFLAQHGLKIFGYYRIILGCLILIL